MTTRNTYATRVAAALLMTALLTVLATGCSIFKRPKNEFYSLTTIPPASAPARAAATGTPVGIDGIELPPGLDRRGIVIRGADHKIEVRGTNQWTAPLEEMVIHTLSFDLAARMPEGMVVLPGAAKPMGAMRALFVNFEELAPGPEQTFVLDARWTLRAADTEVAHHERITIPMTSMDSPAIAEAMSQALAQLADRIAAGV
jgi:uncharacterized lipoprotein YmbA